MLNLVVEDRKWFAEVLLVRLGELLHARIGAEIPVRVPDELLPLRVERVSASLADDFQSLLLLFSS